jgi:RNA polymerase sigma-70 factor (ECF subfamily)
MQPAVTEEQMRGIYRDTIDPLYGYVSRSCGGDRAMAEDVTQETWLRAVKDWPRNGIPDRPIAWLTTVARNLLLNEFRRRPPVPLHSVEPNQLLDAADNGLTSESAEVAAVVNRALSQLPARQGRLLEAFHYERRSVSQIASAFGISERAVEGRLRRARQNLRKELEAALQAAGGIG